MKSSTLGLVVLVGVAVVAIVLSVNSRTDETNLAASGASWAASGAAAQREKMTTEERTVQAEFLTRYSRRKFAPLLCLLGKELTPVKLERLAAILAEREIAFANAKETAAGSAVALDRFMDERAAWVRSEVARECGEATAEKLDAFLRTLPQRLVVSGLNQNLVYAGEGLTIGQMERLCAVIQQHEAPLPGRRPTLAEWDAYLAKENAAVGEMIKEARTFLSSTQAAELEREFALQTARLADQRRTIRLALEREVVQR